MNKQVVVIGDIMLDRYIEGSSNRMSPEAPVPIVLVNEESYRLGGAANVAYNLHKLDVKTHLIGCLGEDSYGSTLNDLIINSGLHNQTLTDHHTTTVKTRIISKSQHLLRIDREKYYTISDKMISHCVEQLKVIQPEIIVISDYAKGMITKEMMDAVKSSAPNAKILIDPKGLDWSKYGNSYLIKPNLSELLAVVKTNDINDISPVELQQLQSSLNTVNLLITLSDKGMKLVNKNGIQQFSIRKAEVYDVTGAGDTAIATLAFGLHNGMKLVECITLANKASRYVVTKPKTYVLAYDELRKLMDSED